MRRPGLTIGGRQIGLATTPPRDGLTEVQRNYRLPVTTGANPLVGVRPDAVLFSVPPLPFLP